MSNFIIIYQRIKLITSVPAPNLFRISPLAQSYADRNFFCPSVVGTVERDCRNRLSPEPPPHSYFALSKNKKIVSKNPSGFGQWFYLDISGLRNYKLQQKLKVSENITFFANALTICFS